MRFRLNQAGDTIVEVMIAVAIVSAVLGGSYSVVNRTTLNQQDNQERAEAINFAQEQVERLKVMAQDATKSSALFAATTPFCIDGGGVLTTFGGSALPATYKTGYPADCLIGTDERYAVGAKQVPSGSNIFQVYVNWEGPTGTKDQVMLVYKVYP